MQQWVWLNNMFGMSLLGMIKHIIYCWEDNVCLATANKVEFLLYIYLFLKAGSCLRSVVHSSMIRSRLKAVIICPDIPLN